ncbi:immunoglobulin superfamily member 3-like [Talpa occidentalis]|uniref:immunoglobulin superfamily member 3-like n=1 Tax=Talpa occidentalis TaxID=50954 RepID=UPI00188E3D38|nr:immunoglobulin superfamily member 3-like [Talpa occidentalis]
MSQNVTFKIGEPVASKDILWKKGKNKVIEWEENLYWEPRSFPPFINRTHLDTQTGNLTIFNVTSSDEDEYEVEYGGAKSSTKFTLKVVDPALRVDTVVPNAMVPEKAAFQLGCSIASHSSQDSYFAVAWFSLRMKVVGDKGSPGLEGQEEQDPTERRALLSVGPDGVFGPEGGPWEDRLRFQRPSLLLFRLTVLQASPQDTGNYSCRVEEWLPSLQGDWYLLAKEESAPISIRVLDTGEFPQLAGEGRTW